MYDLHNVVKGQNMRLNQLVEHTASSLDRGFIETQNFARFMREGGAISTGPKGGAAIEVPLEDKIAFFIGVNAVGTARTSGIEVPHWLRAPFTGPDLAHYGKPLLRCLVAPTLKDSITTLFEEIDSGATEGLLLTVRFEVDECAATILAERIHVDGYTRENKPRERYWGEYGDIAPTLASKLVREVYNHGLHAWAKCLKEERP
jgi:hypothetical protein